MTRTKHEAMEQVGGAGIPAGAVFDTMELHERSDFETARHHAGDAAPDYKPFKMPAWPVRVDGKPPRLEPSPILGQHTDEVLMGWLGLTEGEVEKLRRDSVV